MARNKPLFFLVVLSCFVLSSCNLHRKTGGGGGGGGAVCAANLTAAGTPTIGSFTFTVNSMGQQGIGIDFNLKNAISLSGTTLSVNFNPSSPNPGVLSAVALPKTNANLGANQLDLIEDLSGAVALNGRYVAVTLLTSG